MTDRKDNKLWGGRFERAPEARFAAATVFQTLADKAVAGVVEARSPDRDVLDVFPSGSDE